MSYALQKSRTQYSSPQSLSEETPPSDDGAVSDSYWDPHPHIDAATRTTKTPLLFIFPPVGPRPLGILSALSRRLQLSGQQRLSGTSPCRSHARSVTSRKVRRKGQDDRPRRDGLATTELQWRGPPPPCGRRHLGRSASLGVEVPCRERRERARGRSPRPGWRWRR